MNQIFNVTGSQKFNLFSSFKTRSKILFAQILALSQHKGYCWASNHYLAKRLGRCVRTIRDALKELREEKLVEVEVFRGVVGTSNHRTIRAATDWKVKLTPEVTPENDTRSVQELPKLGQKMSQPMSNTDTSSVQELPKPLDQDLPHSRVVLEENRKDKREEKVLELSGSSPKEVLNLNLPLKESPAPKALARLYPCAEVLVDEYLEEAQSRFPHVIIFKKDVHGRDTAVIAHHLKRMEELFRDHPRVIPLILDDWKEWHLGRLESIDETDPRKFPVRFWVKTWDEYNSAKLCLDAFLDQAYPAARIAPEKAEDAEREGNEETPATARDIEIAKTVEKEEEKLEQFPQSEASKPEEYKTEESPTTDEAETQELAEWEKGIAALDDSDATKPEGLIGAVYKSILQRFPVTARKHRFTATGETEAATTILGKLDQERCKSDSVIRQLIAQMMEDLARIGSHIRGDHIRVSYLLRELDFYLGMIRAQQSEEQCVDHKDMSDAAAPTNAALAAATNTPIPGMGRTRTRSW